MLKRRRAARKQRAARHLPARARPGGFRIGFSLVMLSGAGSGGLADTGAVSGLRVASLEPTAVLEIARARMALDMLAVESILEDQTGRRTQFVERCWMDYENASYHPDPVVQHQSSRRLPSTNLGGGGKYIAPPVTAGEAHLTIAFAHDQATRADGERAYDAHLACDPCPEKRGQQCH